MRGARRRKSYDRVCARDRAHLLTPDVSVGAGGNVHRNNRASTCVQHCDGFGVKSRDWWAKAGAENCIDQNLRVKDSARALGFELFMRRHCDRRHRQLGKHFGGVAAQLSPLSQQ